MEEKSDLIVKVPYTGRGVPIEWEGIRCEWVDEYVFKPSVDGRNIVVIKSLAPGILPKVIDSLSELGELYVYILGYADGYVLCLFRIVPPKEAIEEKEEREAVEEEREEEEVVEGYDQMLEVGLVGEEETSEA